MLWRVLADYASDTLQIDLDQAVKERTLDLSHIASFWFYLEDTSGPTMVYFDNIRLSKKDVAPKQPIPTEFLGRNKPFPKFISAVSRGKEILISTNPGLIAWDGSQWKDDPTVKGAILTVCGDRFVGFAPSESGKELLFWQRGADGLKIYKSLGLSDRDQDGKLVMPDDPRLEPLFAKCAELRVPCLFHFADPIAFFKPLTPQNERWEELAKHPDWHFYGKDYPSFQQLMECQERLLERHPDTIFQGAHVAGCAENLAYVATLLERYPNLYIDPASRLGELGRQPYTAREFLLRFADRILYGTDDVGEMRCDTYYMRFLETRDEYFPYSPDETPPQGRWRIYGVCLPDGVLKKIYCQNAEKLYGRVPP